MSFYTGPNDPDSSETDDTNAIKHRLMSVDDSYFKPGWNIVSHTVELQPLVVRRSAWDRLRIMTGLAPKK
jgi:hypothetical protein